jgi:hypothetical protein
MTSSSAASVASCSGICLRMNWRSGGSPTRQPVEPGHDGAGNGDRSLRRADSVVPVTLAGRVNCSPIRYRPL